MAAHLKANANANANAKTKAVLSGFCDPSGNVAYNEALAHYRALVVRCSLEAAGIPNDRVVMQKPVSTVGDGPPEAAGTANKLA